MFWRKTVISVVYSDLKKLILKNGIDSWTSSCDHKFPRRLSRQECIDELKFLYDDKALSYSTINYWFNEFNCGRRLLKDEVREGPPKTAVVPDNIDAVRELIMPDRHVTSQKYMFSFKIEIWKTNFNFRLLQYLLPVYNYRKS